MGNEILAIYFINKSKYTIYGCWDEETPENEFEFFDVYDENGRCINEGEPFYNIPDREEVKEFID